MSERAGGSVCDREGCRGHRRYIGGRLDGMVEHLAFANHSDFPLTWQHSDGSMYERDLDGGTEAIYRCVR